MASRPGITNSPFSALGNAGDALTTKNATDAVESVTGPLYQPQTVPGQYANTIAEFAPAALLGGGSAGARAAQVLVPAVASETAGQATKGTALEPWARAGAAIAGGIGTAAWQSAKGAKSVLSDNLGGIAEADWNAARALQARGAEQGVNLTLGEALNQVTGGRAQNISRLERVVANSGDDAGQIMNDLYAARPGQVERAARSAFDDLGAAPPNPGALGDDVSAAARAAVDATPEGQALSQAHWRAGPRTSPEQAGRTIQDELQNVFERREGMRAALGDQDYAAARNAPATVPLNEGLREVEGTATALNRREIPIILNQGERDAAKAQWLADNNQSGRFQIVGDRATQFAQVDPTPVIQGIDAAMATAKGAVRDGLAAAKRALMTPDGVLDSSVEGLHGSRVAINDLISQAKRAGANDTARQLEGVVNTLDQALEAVPLYGQARQGFKAASEPLAPFDAARGPGRVIERDQFNKQFTMPPERVPDALSSASDARAFNQVATPAAREAMESRLVTDVLDTMKGRGLDVSAAGIRNAVRKQEDVFAQFPAAKERLLDIAASRDGLAKIEKSLIGGLAKRDMTTQEAVKALFPENPLPGNSQQTFEAVQALSAQKPAVANQLVRTYVEQVFNRTARELTGGPNVNGGARFVTDLVGNSEKAANMRAAIRGLKNGDDILPGFERLMETLEATRWRPTTGSATAFNQEVQRELTGGAGALGKMAEHITTGGLRLPKAIGERWSDWRAGRNTAELARILTDPKATLLFKTLGTTEAGSAKAIVLTARLTALARQAAENGNGKR
ncbi:hypothetical protein ACFONL_23170 [Camelimonas fluminis]|uniref:DdrB-like domain-containing protein n=1 Tax=Camelimonas fluminis TaxID=1576911 RepID=A0ABV7UPJ4_9HYPH|nr:hypothetical protein [Camelimonas fluminis]